MRTAPWTPSLLVCVLAMAACTATAADDAGVGLAATVEPPATTPSADASTHDGATSAATTEPAAAAGPTADAVVASEAAPANAAALDFTARRLDGGTIDGVQFAGGDVVLWMWAPWCPQCNREAEHVAEAVAAYGDEVTFVGIAGHDRDEAHRAFVAEHGLEDLVHLVDDDGSLWARYGIDYQPAWVFVDEDGATQVVAGGLYDDLDARVRALVDG